ncbi:MAG: transglutaminase family protein [Syntrophobacteraceae bacterium]
MKRIALAVIAICLGTLLVVVLMRHIPDLRRAGVEDGQNAAAYPRKKQVHYSFTLQNEADRLLERAELWTYGPVKATSTQRCDRLGASHPYDLTTDDTGNQVLHFTFRDLPPYGVKIVTIRADLSLSDTPSPMAQGSVEGTVRPQRYIESDDPRVVQLAKDIRANQAIDRPRAYFRWVSENIRDAGYTREDRGALDCLTRRAGDCTEQMYLFVALCRAAGIPARGVGGYVCEGDCILKPNDFHNWAEFYQTGAWRLADPHKRVFMESPSRYIAMRVMEASDRQEANPMGSYHRFHFEGEGLMVRMNE